MFQRKNPFPRPTPLQRRLLQELTQVAARCYERGWAYGTAGNFSLRGTDGLIWQSPTGLNKGALNPDLFIPVDLATGCVVEPYAPRPSGEMPLHLAIYRAVAEAGCVVHAHPSAVVRETQKGTPLVFQGREMQKHLGCRDHLEALTLPVLENPRDMNDMGPALDKAVSELLETVGKKAPMVILESHGVYAWGATPLAALSYLEAAEYLCLTR